LSPYRCSDLRSADVGARIRATKRDQMLAGFVEANPDLEALSCGVGDAIGGKDQLPGASVDAIFAAHDSAGQIGRIEHYLRCLASDRRTGYLDGRRRVVYFYGVGYLFVG